MRPIYNVNTMTTSTSTSNSTTNNNNNGNNNIQKNIQINATKKVNDYLDSTINHHYSAYRSRSANPANQNHEEATYGIGKDVNNNRDERKSVDYSSTTNTTYDPDFIFMMKKTTTKPQYQQLRSSSLASSTNSPAAYITTATTASIIATTSNNNHKSSNNQLNSSSNAQTPGSLTGSLPVSNTSPSYSITSPKYLPFTPNTPYSGSNGTPFSYNNNNNTNTSQTSSIVTTNTNSNVINNNMVHSPPKISTATTVVAAAETTSTTATTSNVDTSSLYSPSKIHQIQKQIQSNNSINNQSIYHKLPLSERFMYNTHDSAAAAAASYSITSDSNNNQHFTSIHKPQPPTTTTTTTTTTLSSSNYDRINRSYLAKNNRQENELLNYENYDFFSNENNLREEEEEKTEKLKKMSKDATNNSPSHLAESEAANLTPIDSSPVEPQAPSALSAGGNPATADHVENLNLTTSPAPATTTTTITTTSVITKTVSAADEPAAANTAAGSTSSVKSGTGKDKDVFSSVGITYNTNTNSYGSGGDGGGGGGSSADFRSTKITESSDPGRFISSPSANYSAPYRSTIAPRPTVISRRAADFRGPNSHAVTTYHTNYSTIVGNPISLRPTGASTAAGLALKESRQKEKRQLSELNDRFAGYVERVRFLEAQNKKLQMELGILKGKWGQETKQIEKMYQIELEEARSVLNDTSKSKDGLQVKLIRSEHDLDDIKRKYFDLEKLLNQDKDKINSLQDHIAANESEIGLLRRRLQDLQDEEKRYKQETQRMISEIQRVSFELESEMKQRLSLENDKQSLEEELCFLKEIHAKEIEELKHLTMQDSGLDPSLFFKSELANAIREIREEYEALNQTQRNELEGWYRIKVTEIQRKNAQAITASEPDSALNREQARKLKLQVNDSKRNISDLKAKNAELECRIRDLEDELRREESETNMLMKGKEDEIVLLRDELSKIMSEYDELMTTKSDLEVEIRTYRKLLEGEENRDGLKQIVETIEQRARALGGGGSGSSADNNQKTTIHSYTVSSSAGGYSSVYNNVNNNNNLTNNRIYYRQPPYTSNTTYIRNLAANNRTTQL